MNKPFTVVGRFLRSIPYGKGKAYYEDDYVRVSDIVSIPYGKGKEESSHEAACTYPVSIPYGKGKEKIK